MSLETVFTPSEDEQKIVTDRFSSQPISMNFWVGVPQVLAHDIYTQGAQFGLNKTNSLLAIFQLGLREYVKLRYSTPKKTKGSSSGAKRKSSKSKTEGTSKS